MEEGNQDQDFSPLDSRNVSRDESDEGQYFSDAPIPRTFSSHSLFGEALLPGRGDSPWLLSPCQSAQTNCTTPPSVTYPPSLSPPLLETRSHPLPMPSPIVDSQSLPRPVANRPPRAPLATRNISSISSVTRVHNRVHSDVSQMSALTTESSLDERKSSFENILDVLQQPILDDPPRAVFDDEGDDKQMAGGIPLAPSFLKTAVPPRAFQREAETAVLNAMLSDRSDNPVSSSPATPVSKPSPQDNCFTPLTVTASEDIDPLEAENPLEAWVEAHSGWSRLSSAFKGIVRFKRRDVFELAMALGVAIAVRHCWNPIVFGMTVSWWLLFVLRHMLIWKMGIAMARTLVQLTHSTIMVWMMEATDIRALQLSVYAMLCGLMLPMEGMASQAMTRMGFLDDGENCQRITTNVHYQQYLMVCFTVGVAKAVTQVLWKYSCDERIYARYNYELTLIDARIGVVRNIAALSTFRGDSPVMCNDPCTSELSWISEMRSHTIESSCKREVETAANSRRQDGIGANDMSLSAVLTQFGEFYRLIGQLSTKYIFSAPFGEASSIDDVDRCSLEVFNRLTSDEEDQQALRFSTIQEITTFDGASLSQYSKLKILKDIFRPGKDGLLSASDFVESVRKVYEDASAFLKAIQSSKDIEGDFERIIDFGLCILLASFLFAILGVESAVNTTIVAGLLVGYGCLATVSLKGAIFVLSGRPFELGDCVSIGERSVDDPSNASLIVGKITLFRTVFRSDCGGLETWSNEALANKRIAVLPRIGNASVQLELGFETSVSSDKIDLFYHSVKAFLDDHPEQFSPSLELHKHRVGIASKTIYYQLTAEVLESWRNIGVVQESKADLACFCVEVMLMLRMGGENGELGMV